MIRLSTKQRYATRILVFLAARPDTRPVTKADIARAEDIPVDYVAQICMKLRTAGLITSHRGKRGGFTLALPPQQITVRDALIAIEGYTSIVPCIDHVCRRSHRCAAQAVWRKANDAMNTVFSGVTIASMAEDTKRLEAERAPSFEI